MTTSEPELWIVVRSWKRHQHYSDRNPPWIKNYTRLLHDHNYLSLTGDQRAILHGLWLEYASSDGQLPLDTRSLTRRLALRVTSRQLESLNHAGFIRFVASKPLALARRQETETDVEKKNDDVEPLTTYDEELFDFDQIKYSPREMP